MIITITGTNNLSVHVSDDTDYYFPLEMTVKDIKSHYLLIFAQEELYGNIMKLQSPDWYMLLSKYTANNELAYAVLQAIDDLWHRIDWSDYPRAV